MTTVTKFVSPLAQLANSSELTKAIRTTIKASSEMDNMIQRVAEQCVFYSHIHGDVNYSKMLLEGIKGKGKGIRYNSLKKYLMHFGAIFENDKKELKMDKQRRNVDIFNDAEFIKSVIETKWHSFKHVDDEVKAVSFDTVVKSLKRFQDAKLTKDLSIESIDKLMAELSVIKEMEKQRLKIIAN